MKSKTWNKQANSGVYACGSTISRVLIGLALALLVAGCQSPQPEPVADVAQPAAMPAEPVADAPAPVAASSSDAVSCPSQDFNEFLKAYASDESVRKRFTAPVVKVARISDEGVDGYQTVIESVKGADYSGFLLSYRNGKFGFAGGEDQLATDAPGLQLIIKQEANGAYFVTFPDNVEAISYRFERHDDCWLLTEDPEANP